MAQSRADANCIMQMRVRSVGMEGAGHSAWSAAATAVLPGSRAAPAKDTMVASEAAAAARAPNASAAPAKRRASREPAAGPACAGNAGRAAKRPEKRGACTRMFLQCGSEGTEVAGMHASSGSP